MPQSLSAKKRLRQNIKRRSRNRGRKKSVRQAVREFNDAVAAGDAEKASQHLRQCYRQLDEVAQKGTIHKNAAARKKARLTKKLSQMKSQ